jgi:AraC-like DNA-binding protein
VPVARIAYSSSDVSAGRFETRRLDRWCERYFEAYGGVEIIADWEAPAAISLQYLPLGSFGIRAERAPPIRRFHRPRERVARDRDDHFTLIIDRGSSATERATPWRSIMIPAAAAILFDRSEPSTHICPHGSNRLVLIMPRPPTRRALPNVEDLVGTVIAPGNEALRLLALYADGLLSDGDDWADSSVLACAGQNLLDLVVLAFGTNRDNIEIARLRGLRAARLAAVLRIIRSDYADSALSPDVVARRVGISIRYLHDLLHDTGTSFSERVQELRLAKALKLLQNNPASACKISDAAYAAGFLDLSHFNRLFRRRFGVTPTVTRKTI